MKFETGKRYINRGGETVRIVKITASEHPVLDVNWKATYERHRIMTCESDMMRYAVRGDGRYAADESVYDLIAEAPESAVVER